METRRTNAALPTIDAIHKRLRDIEGECRHYSSEECSALKEEFKELAKQAYDLSKKSSKELFDFYELCVLYRGYNSAFAQMFFSQIDSELNLVKDKDQVTRLLGGYLVDSASGGYPPAIIEVYLLELKSLEDRAEIARVLHNLYDMRETRENASSAKTAEKLTSCFLHYALPVIKPQNAQWDALVDRIKDKKPVREEDETQKEVFIKLLFENIRALKKFHSADTITEKKKAVLQQLMHHIELHKGLDLKYIINMWKDQYYPGYGSIYNLIKEQRRVTGFFSYFNPEKTKTQTFIDKFCPVQLEPQHKFKHENSQDKTKQRRSMAKRP